MLDTTLYWVNMTPFGRPVVPLEYGRADRSSLQSKSRFSGKDVPSSLRRSVNGRQPSACPNINIPATSGQSFTASWQTSLRAADDTRSFAPACFRAWDNSPSHMEIIQIRIKYLGILYDYLLVLLLVYPDPSGYTWYKISLVFSILFTFMVVFGFTSLVSLLLWHWSLVLHLWYPFYFDIGLWFYIFGIPFTLTLVWFYIFGIPFTLTLVFGFTSLVSLLLWHWSLVLHLWYPFYFDIRLWFYIFGIPFTLTLVFGFTSLVSLLLWH